MHPILLRLQGTPIYAYGFFLALSLAAGLTLTLHLARRDRVPEHELAVALLIGVIGALAGARLVSVITDPSATLADFFVMKRGGLSLLGALFGGSLVTAIAVRRSGIRFLAAADLAAPGVALASGLGRIGCYLFGCDFGIPLAEDAPRWLKRAGTFPRWAEGTLAYGSGSPAWVQHVKERGLSISSSASLPVHPTQLYELLLGLSIAVVLIVGLSRRHAMVQAALDEQGKGELGRGMFRGHIFLTFVFLMGSARFLIETLREDTEGHGAWALSFPAAVAVPVGAALLGIVGARLLMPEDAPIGRPVSYGLSVLGGLLLFLVMRPGQGISYGATNAWTLTQALSLLAALTAAVMSGWLSRRALTDPRGAMAIYLPGFEPKEAPRRRKKRGRAA